MCEGVHGCCHCSFHARTKAALANHLRTHGVKLAPSVDLKPIKRRKRPTNKTKLNVVTQLLQFYKTYGNTRPREDFIKHIGYSSSTVWRWERCPRLRQVAELPHLACFKRLRSIVKVTSKFKKEYDELYDRFIYKRRGKGEQVDTEWFVKNMKEILAKNQPLGWEKLKCSAGWVAKYLKRYRISCQLQTEKKHMANAIRVPMLQTFHRELCILQQSRQDISKPCPEWGRFPPEAIWNVDQIPYSFVQTHRRSFNPKGEACWVRKNGQSGNDKRMATIIMTLRASGEQVVKPFILFRGKGHLSKKVLAELDAVGIPYGFNEKAWADGPACLAHLTYFHGELKKHCPQYPEHMLLMDGLTSQSTHTFIDFALDLNILPVYFPPNCTHLVQPVDHRVAAWFKKALQKLYLIEEEVMGDDWLRFRANKSMNTQYLRATTLKFINAAWGTLVTKTNFLLDAFLSTGCLIPLSGNHQIKFKDIELYNFEYPKVIS